jgi:hypothetical protein
MGISENRHSWDCNRKVCLGVEKENWVGYIGHKVSSRQKHRDSGSGPTRGPVFLFFFGKRKKTHLKKPGVARWYGALFAGLYWGAVARWADGPGGFNKKTGRKQKTFGTRASKM